MFRLHGNIDYALERLKASRQPAMAQPPVQQSLTQTGRSPWMGPLVPKAFASSNVIYSPRKGGKLPYGIESFAQSNIFTQPTFYSPLHTPQNWQIPSKRREQYQWCRYFYENEPKVGAAIDFYSHFPLSGFETQCKDPRVKRIFDNLNRKLDIDYWAPMILKEKILLGDVFPMLDVDCKHCGGTGIDKRGRPCMHPGGTFRRMVVLNPDWVDVQTNVLADEPVITLLPDDELRKVVWYKTPLPIYNRIPPNVRNLIIAGRPIPLDNGCVSHLKYNPYPYGTYGVSMIRRLFKTLTYKDKLMTAQWIVAERLILPIRVVKVGDAERPAGDQDIAAVQAQLAQVINDPNLTLVTHHALDYDWVGTNGKVLQLSNEYELIDKEILQGLMINEALLSGQQGGYQSAAIGAETLIQRLEQWRNEFSRWIEEKIYRNFARMKVLEGDKSFIDEEATREFGEDNGEPIFKIPTVKWNDLNIRDDSQQKQVWMQLHDKQVISTQSLCEKFGINYDQEVERTRWESSIQQMGQGAMGGPGGAPMGGGGMGGGMDMLGGGGAPMGGAPGGMPGADMGMGMGGAPMGGDTGLGMGGGMGTPGPAVAASNPFGGSMGKIMSKDKASRIKPPEEEAVQPWQTRLTSLEQTMAKTIVAMQIPFKTWMQFPLGRYKSDFAIPALKLAIECDGEYWHTQPQAQAHDQKRDSELSKYGWTVLRFAERHIKENIEEVKKTISVVVHKCWQRALDEQKKAAAATQERAAAVHAILERFGTIEQVESDLGAPVELDNSLIERIDGQADQGQGNQVG